MAKPDAVRALVAYLRGRPAVTGLVGQRVFAEDVPESENATMPRPLVVVATAGGGLLARSELYGDVRVDVRCYGVTLAAARGLHLEVRAALKALRRKEISDSATSAVLLHWARISADGSSRRDVLTGWPLCSSTWQILAADIAA